jgi:acetolactate synthase-1/2/3 large subunit
MGDGSFGFTCGELETVVRHGVPLKMIVFWQRRLRLDQGQPEGRLRPALLLGRLPRTDHARVAEAFGVKAWRVEDPAQVPATAAGRAAHDGPALVDVVSQPLQDSAVPVSTWMG